MVSPEHADDRSTTLPDGAPPLPPRGGYRHARRVVDDHTTGPTASADPPPSAPPGGGTSAVSGPPALTSDAPVRASVLRGWVSTWLAKAVLSVTVVFVVGILIAMAGGSAAGLWSVGPVLLQLGVVGFTVFALRVKTARVAAIAALTLSLFLNVGTVGAMGTLRAAQERTYPGVATFDQEHARGFPGRKGRDTSDRATGQRDRPTYEQIRDGSEAMMAAIREAITLETGAEWVEHTPARTEPVPNGYGGTSMFLEYTAPIWTTANPPRTLAEKTAMIDAFTRVVKAEKHSNVSHLNDPAEWDMDRDFEIERWGSDDVATQHTWESHGFDDRASGTITMVDLSTPTAGKEARKYRDYVVRWHGEPLEGVILTTHQDSGLPASDVQDYIQRMQKYPDL